MFKFVPILFLAVSGCFGATVQLLFTNLPATSFNGTSNGFTTATVDGIPGILLICDDESHTTTVPQSPALPYDYSTLPTLAHARFTPSTTVGSASFGETQVQLYEEAAIMVWQLTNIYSTATAQTIADYQYALWNLMNNSDPLIAADTTAEKNIQTNAKNMMLANTALDQTIYSHLIIYTPQASDASNQEFLRLTPSPEPATVGGAALILSGFGIAAWRRRKLQTQA